MDNSTTHDRVLKPRTSRYAKRCWLYAAILSCTRVTIARRMRYTNKITTTIPIGTEHAMAVRVM